MEFHVTIRNRRPSGHVEWLDHYAHADTEEEALAKALKFFAPKAVLDSEVKPRSRWI